jgi:hypothetical protein
MLTPCYIRDIVARICFRHKNWSLRSIGVTEIGSGVTENTIKGRLFFSSSFSFRAFRRSSNEQSFLCAQKPPPLNFFFSFPAHTRVPRRVRSFFRAKPNPNPPNAIFLDAVVGRIADDVKAQVCQVWLKYMDVRKNPLKVDGWIQSRRVTRTFLFKYLLIYFISHMLRTVSSLSFSYLLEAIDIH